MKGEPVEHVLSLGLLTSICLALLLLSCVGCGGGGSSPSASGPIAPPPILRTTALQVSYYGGCTGQVEKTYKHVNLHWAMGWCEDRALTIAQAKQRGQKVVLFLPEAYESDQAVRDLFTLYHGMDLLPSIAYLYPADEPDLRYPESKINQANERARRIGLEFGIHPKIAAIYAGSNDFPGIESLDVIGIDDYGRGENILIDFAGVRGRLRPGQTFMLVPGGADPWRQDPALFFAYARIHEDVEIIASFLYSPDFADRGLGLAIEHNGMAPAYCQAAIEFTGGTC